VSNILGKIDAVIIMLLTIITGSLPDLIL